MPKGFFDIAFTEGVKEQQAQHGSRRQYERVQEIRSGGNQLGQSERHFVSLRDSFYMASVSETGWPYIQHRGGPPGFVHVLQPSQLGFADLRGNRQYISLGNLLHDNRVALFFMDYPNQTRLKILGHVEIHENDAAAPELFKKLRTTEPNSVIERAILIHVEGFDWNCPQHITPRYTLAEMEPSLAQLRRRLADLESENKQLREQMKGQSNQTP